MEWLWLILCLAALGALWALIMGVEYLVKHIKMRDDMRQIASQELEAKIEREEADFVRVRAAKDYLESSHSHEPREKGKVPEEFRNAMMVLSSDELLDSMVKKVFNNRNESGKNVAAQSALDVQPEKVAVAGNSGVVPVKAKPSTKSALSKSEQKIYKKIKQGA